MRDAKGPLDVRDVPSGNGGGGPAVVLAASLGAVETLSQRRRRVEKMPAEQRDDLFRSEQEFRDLSPQEQQRIRDLHDQIESDPDREKLLATMGRYCKWLKTQRRFRREKLLDKKMTLKDRLQDGQGIRGKARSEQGHPPGRQEAGSAWPPGSIATAEHGPDSWRAWPRSRRKSPSFRRNGSSGPPRDALAALAEGRSRRSDAHRRSRDGSTPRRAFAGTADEVGSKETRRAEPDHHRVAPRDGLPRAQRTTGGFLRQQAITIKSAIG